MIKQTEVDIIETKKHWKKSRQEKEKDLNDLITAHK